MECTFLSLHRAAGRVGRGSLWSVCHMKVAGSLFLSLLCLPLFSHHQDEQWLIITYLLGFIYIWRLPWTEKPGYIYIYTYIWCFPGFPGGSDGKASACNVGDPGSISGLGRSPREGNGNPLQYSCLENSMDGGTWKATVHRVTESWIQLSDFILTMVLSMDRGAWRATVHRIAQS